MASGSTSTYGLPYPLPTDGVDVAEDMGNLATSVEGVLLTKASNASVALKANIASPTFTGTPSLTTTPSADDNTTKLASTAFVIGQASSTTPIINGTAAVGTSLKYARADHVHASDTSKANLSGATFTGAVNINSTLGITGNLTGTSASFTGNLTGTSASFTGNLTGTSASFSSNLTGTSASFSSNIISITPTLDNHVATKGYVDSNISSFFLMGG